MNNLCADIGYKSINHDGEQLCGDHVEIIEQNDNSSVIVLADGLGSGVKASILSTLTSKIISTMMAEGLPLEECVSTIAATLPICSVRGVAYSTFTIIHIINNDTAELIQYDNPLVILLRDCVNYDYPKSELNIDGKKIYKSVIKLQENDIFIAMSDGCPHAGIGLAYNFGWKREDIIDFMETFAPVGYTAKTLSTLLVDECDKQYGFKPGDDATACVVRIRKREPMNILFGPPRNPDDCDRMMSLFFSKEGKHIVCGGTTSSIAAKYLHKPLKASLNFVKSDVPPTAEIEGVDLVTEGVITINKVIEYAKDTLDENELYSVWSVGRDGASMICRMLFEEATDINFYVGRAVNPAHQNPDLPINFNIKMNLVEELSACLKQMGKRIKVSYF
ncbi:MAG: SpoIIE family protein phosphatase [Oscillospiraceae bacterium]|nr:serine/threonine-protein phosphatase [Oscillospiraceae bacterium]MDD7355159.1 SpoIIE family protein phosphatase [Oscillospiraceae bacterium]MDY3938001.1 SpoIIE family protein phosphatase [Oscillospiraceae bacterium]